MKKLMILLLSVSSMTIAYGQRVYNYEKGFIIKKTGDTINCYVPISIYYEDAINIKKNINSSDSAIRISDVKYLITPYNQFENISLNKTEKLMRQLASGRINLYSYIIPDEGTNPNGGFYFSAPPTISYAIQIGNSYIEIKKKNYKAVLTEQLHDCPSIIAKFGSKGYQYSDVETIINEYNTCRN